MPYIPTPGIKCIVRYKTGDFTRYDFENKTLSIDNLNFTIFDSKARANSAVHHSLDETKIEPWLDYKVLPMQAGK